MNRGLVRGKTRVGGGSLKAKGGPVLSPLQDTALARLPRHNLQGLLGVVSLLCEGD